MEKFCSVIKKAWKISTFIIGIIVIVISVSYAFEVYDKVHQPPNLFELIYSGLFYILCAIGVLTGVILTK